MNSQNQMPQLNMNMNNPQNNNTFGFGNPTDSENSQVMKLMLLKNQALGGSQSNNMTMNNQSQHQQPSNQNFPGNLNMMMNANEKRKNSFGHPQNSFQPQMFNQPANSNQQSNQMTPQNHNSNFFNFNNNFPQNLLKNMMNNKGMLPNNSSNENKMKPPEMNFNMKKQLPPQMPSIPQINPPQAFNNREIFPQIDNLNPLNSNETDLSKIKEKTKIDRNQKIEKYKNKKRNWKKKISYDCRKKVADARLRIKGRFISKMVLNALLIFFFNL